MPLKLKSLNNQEPGAGGGSNKMPAKKKKPNANYSYGGGSVMKMDPQYKSAGGTVFKGR